MRDCYVTLGSFLVGVVAAFMIGKNVPEMLAVNFCVSMPILMIYFGIFGDHDGYPF